MHPAVSVIFFTVMSGAGFGFMAMLGVGLPLPSEPVFAFMICAIAAVSYTHLTLPTIYSV